MIFFKKLMYLKMLMKLNKIVHQNVISDAAKCCHGLGDYDLFFSRCNARALSLVKE